MSHQDWIHMAVVTFESRLVRYTNRILNNVELSREVVQDCFLKLCRMEEGKVSQHLAQWLYTVCRNSALDIKRKEKPMSFEDVGESHSGPGQGVQEDLEQKQNLKKILLSLDSLSGEEKEVVLLKFQDGLSYKEISEITGHSVSYVGVLLHSSMNQLRSILVGGGK